MTAMSNLVQSVDWSKRGAKEWVIQYGLWVGDNRLKDPSDYRTRRVFDDKGALVQYSITDDEARAVCRLLCDLKQAMPPEGAAVIMHLELRVPVHVIAARVLWSQNRVQQAIDAGVAYLKKRMGLE